MVDYNYCQKLHELDLFANIVTSLSTMFSIEDDDDDGVIKLYINAFESQRQ